MQNINFLAQENLRLSDQQKKDLRIFKYAAIVFGTVAIIFTILLGLRFYFQYKTKRVKAQISQATKQINNSQQLEADYLFFVNKLKVIRELFEQRSSKQIAMGYFNNLFGPNITISGITYNMEEGILSLRVSSPHVFYLEEALEVLEDPAVGKNFSSMSKTDLSRSITAQYTFNLTVSFKEDSDLIEETGGLNDYRPNGQGSNNADRQGQADRQDQGGN